MQRPKRSLWQHLFHRYLMWPDSSPRNGHQHFQAMFQVSFDSETRAGGAGGDQIKFGLQAVQGNRIS